jgi:RNA polymerase sigma-70 factor (ECF subfamily)
MIANDQAAESQSDRVRRALEDYEGPLLGYANSILGDVEAARDAVQDTFLKLYKQPQGSIGPGLKSWLFTVCRNRCFDMLRKNRWFSDADVADLNAVDERAADPGEAAVSEEALNDVARFLERLPRNQQEVVRLKFGQGLSYKEISQITGLSVSNVGFLLHVALKRLRKLLNHLGASQEQL